MNVTRADLVDVVEEAGDLTRSKASACLEAVLEAITEALLQGEGVELRGFGSFRIRERGPRRGRNPKTGAAVQIPAKRIAYFKPGKLLRKRLAEWSEPE